MVAMSSKRRKKAIRELKARGAKTQPNVHVVPQEEDGKPWWADSDWSTGDNDLDGEYSQDSQDSQESKN
jgi:hypothetical protein